jgi:cytochrome o ubiquinol oxidase operon protein cyoD
MRDLHNSLTARIIGFASSLLLTGTAFWVIIRPSFFYLEVKEAAVAILILACLQAVAQSIFFLNILGEKGPRWNLVIFASTLSIILIIVLGSLWIMHHLDYRMISCHLQNKRAAEIPVTTTREKRNICFAQRRSLLPLNPWRQSTAQSRLSSSDSPK